jgi:hypothetical protein
VKERRVKAMDKVIEVDSNGQITGMHDDDDDK